MINRKNDKINKPSKLMDWKRDIVRNYDLYLLSLPAFILVILFAYIPMYGVQIAFKDFNPGLGIWGSQWVGFEHFFRFFNAYYFWDIIKNTVVLSFYSLAIGFPLPIIFAIMINELKGKHFKKTVQMVSYAPNFISTVVIVGMLSIFFSPQNGIINNIITMLGGDAVSFMTDPKWFSHIYVWSGIWQGIGFSSIIYVSALSGIDLELYDAAKIDGANKFQKIWNIDLPGILPTIIVLLILNMGSVLNVGFEKVFLMQNTLNSNVSEIISTYVYKVGIQGAEYSFSAAIGLFNSIINAILLVMVNFIARKVSDTSLW